MRTHEKNVFGLQRWASATIGVAFFGYFFVSILKSIGRIYSTCNLQESNRRVSTSHEATSYLAGFRLPAERV